MGKELIINISSYEKRVALLENGNLAEFYCERVNERGILGNIYKGKVVRVLPGMQAAFVDIGLEKAAFLYVTDIIEDFDDYEILIRNREERNGKEDAGENSDYNKESFPSKIVPDYSIEDILREGQDILVQISKEPIGSKGARITTHISFPGRHLVYLPMSEHIGISRRIEDEEERKKLKSILLKVKPEVGGFIARTVSEGKSEEDFQSDINYLVKMWDNISKKKESVPVPSLVYQELDLPLRVVRDLFVSEIQRLIVDSEEEYKRIMELVTAFMPALKGRVELYSKDEPIFDYFGIEIEISKALGKKVWLKSGGYIVIEQTEALTAIDVNTGKFVGKRNLEETILKTNLEAVKEIAYQLRLRNIGGIIIIDFIDMENHENREKVYSSLEEALKNDKAKTNILKISELGLVEMTRKRTREGLLRTLCEPCPYCDGRSYIKSRKTICYEIFRKIRKEGKSSKGTKIVISVNPEIAEILFDEERYALEDIEKDIWKKIVVKPKEGLHQEQYEISHC